MTETIEIYIDGEDIECEVEYTASRYIPATWDDPEEGGIEIEGVRVSGTLIDPTPKMIDAIVDYITEMANTY